MKIDDILKLVNAGYSKDDIAALDDTTDQKTDEKKDQKTDEKKEQKTDEKKDNSFDYDKFASALVKAQQLANGKTNFGGSNDKTDISKFF
nr:MAG TPA: hypothetical protein [Caudoviricetes sp.]